MSDGGTEATTYVVIDGRRFAAPSDCDLADLKRRFEEAAQAGPAFVGLSGGGATVHVLVGPTSEIAIATGQDVVGQVDFDLRMDLHDWEF